MEDTKKISATRFEPVDIRAISDSELDDIVGGVHAAPAAVKKA